MTFSRHRLRPLTSTALALAIATLVPSGIHAAGTHVYITAPNGSTSSTDPTTAGGVVIPGYTSDHRYDGPAGKTSTTDTYFPTSLNGLPVTDVTGRVVTPAGAVTVFDAGFVGGGPAPRFFVDLSVALNNTVPADQPLTFPLLVSSGNSLGSTLFGGIDLSSYAASPSSFQIGDTLSFNDGVSSSFAGAVVGTSAVTFDTNQGYVTSDPFTGTATVSGFVALSPVPEPSGLVLMTLGASISLLSLRILGGRKKAASAGFQDS